MRCEKNFPRLRLSGRQIYGVKRTDSYVYILASWDIISSNFAWKNTSSDILKINNSTIFNDAIYCRTIPLWEKGEKTEKQPVAVYDVAGGIVAIAKNPKNTAGKTYQFVGYVNEYI